MNNPSKEITFTSFLLSYVSLSVIAGLFTFRLLNSFLDNILSPLLDLTCVPNYKFDKLSKIYNVNREVVKDNKYKVSKNDYVNIFKPGIFLKELIIWCIIMIILYLIAKNVNKNKMNNP